MGRLRSPNNKLNEKPKGLDMKFTATLEQEIKVVFTEPEKAKAFFIDGDWRESFFEFSHLEQLAEFLMLNTSDKLRVMDHWREDGELHFGANIEGFPYFYKTADQQGLATKENPIIGQIIITGDSEVAAAYLQEVK